jgi:hypothetical protein
MPQPFVPWPGNHNAVCQGHWVLDATALPQSGSKAYLYVVTRTADVAGKLAVCADSSSAAHLGCARETSSSSQIIPPP